MRDDPFRWWRAPGRCADNPGEPSEWRLMSAIAHITPDAFQEFIKRPRRIVKHRHLLARLCQVRSHQNVLVRRDFFAASVQIRGSSKQRVRREPDPTTRISLAFHPINCKIDNFAGATWIAHVDSLRKPPSPNRRINARDQFWKGGEICNRRRPKSFRLGKTF